MPLHSYLAPRQDVPGITLSSVKLKNPKNRCLGTMPLRAMGLRARLVRSSRFSRVAPMRVAVSPRAVFLELAIERALADAEHSRGFLAVAAVSLRVSVM